jgi:hypothetical protein
MTGTTALKISEGARPDAGLPIAAVPTVRLAMPTDSDEILELLKIRNAEERRGPMDVDKVMDAVTAGICRRGALIGIIRGASRIVASIGLYLDRDWDSAVPLVKSRWDFVHPEHRRKTTHARDLITFAKYAAGEMGCPLEMVQTENPDTAEKVKMVGRQMPLGAKIFIVLPTAPSYHLDPPQG